MSKRRIAIALLSSAIVILLSLDFLLWHVDPAGVVAYHADFNDLMALAVPAPDGYRFVPGYHQFRQYHAVIGIDGLRGVPGSGFGECRIAFVGDSLTFGMGANLSFVDLLAPELDTTVINAGLPGYSAANVAQVIRHTPADGYVWLIVENDDALPYTWSHGSGQFPSAINLYLGWLFPGASNVTKDTAGFIQTAAPILARDDMLAFAFGGVPLTEEAAAMGATVIPWYSGYVSQSDAHPNAQGAQQIAAAVHDPVLAFVQQQCQGVR